MLGLLLLSAGTALSYYVDAIWYESLGFKEVFWTTLNLQAVIFIAFALATFAILYGSFVALKPPHLGELAGLPILINGQPIRLPVEPVINLAAARRRNPHRADHRRRDDGRLDVVRALLVRSSRRGRGGRRGDGRSDLRPSDHLLSLHAADLADGQRLADDAGRRRHRDGGGLRGDHRRHARCSPGDATPADRRGAGCRSRSASCC